MTVWQTNRESAGPDTTTPLVESRECASESAEGILLSDITQWRESLARSIARNNYVLRSEEIGTAVNRIIFQLLFLRIAEDRSLVELGTLENIYSSGDVREAYEKISRKIDNTWFYPGNSDQNKNKTVENPVVDEQVMNTILSGLCSSERPYNFATIPAEAIAHVFGYYLSRAVRRLATHRAEVVDTYSAIRSGRISDPAPAMIEYLVQNTLNAALFERSARQIRPIRILDPACGPGVTLLRAFKFLIDSRRSTNLTFAEKKEILLDSIHGVDIDCQCIAAAKFLLVVKLLENECAESLPGDFFTLIGEVFRGLQRTLLCGNALISPEIKNGEEWMFCTPHERYLLNLFDWKTGFPEICASGGFDVVIGIPPAGTLESHKVIQHYFQRHYTVYHPMSDRSAYFIEKGLSLLRRNGNLGYILNDLWFRGKAGAPLRQVLKKIQIKEIVHFKKDRETGRNPSACIVLVTNCKPSHPFFVARIGPSFTGHLSDFIRHCRFRVDPSLLDDGGWIFRDTRIRDITIKAQTSGTRLEEFVMGQVFSGVEIGADKSILINENVKEHLLADNPECGTFVRPFVQGKEITRYLIPAPQKYLVYFPGGWEGEQAGSHLYSWLKRQHPEIARRVRLSMKNPGALKGQGDAKRRTDHDREFQGDTTPRIFFRKRFKNPEFAFDEGWTFPDHTTGIIISSSLYLLGLLNSRLSVFLFNNFIQISGTEHKLHSWDDLRNLPVYTIDFDNPDDKIRYDRMISLVKEMLGLHQHLHLAKTDVEKRLIMREIESTDRQIDSLVYGLYGLTSDEIDLVEISTRREISGYFNNHKK